MKPDSSGWRRHLTYANTMSTLAACLLLAGGTALAAGLPKKGSVNSRTIKNGSLTSADLANGRGVRGVDVADGSLGSADLGANTIGGADLADGSLTGANLADGTIRGADIGNDAIGLTDLARDSVDTVHVVDGSLGGTDVGTDTVTGLDVLESSLGTVPDAAQLGNFAARAYLTRGRIVEREFTREHPFIPGKIEAECNPGERVLSGGPANVAATSEVLWNFPTLFDGQRTGWVVLLETNGVPDPYSVGLICFSPEP